MVSHSASLEKWGKFRQLVDKCEVASLFPNVLDVISLQIQYNIRIVV